MITAQEENNNLSIITGNGLRRCKVLSLTIAKLYFADVDPNIWRNTGWCGYLSLVQDYDRRCYCLRLVDFKDKRLVWEQELYLEMQLKQLKENFYVFAGDTFMCGLSFCYEIDPSEMVQKVCKLLERRRAKLRGESVVETEIPASRQFTTAPKKSPAQEQPPPATTVKSKTDSGKRGFFSLKKKKPKTAAEHATAPLIISGPYEFRHVAHVGPTSISFQSLPENWKQALSLVGLTQNDLQNENVAAALSDAMAKHGDTQATQPAAPTPAHAAPTSTLESPSRTPSPSPAPSDLDRGSVEGFPAPPPPPPPPPPPSLPSAKHDSEADVPAPREPDSERDLLSEIRTGFKLKKVEDNPPPSPQPQQNEEVKDMASLFLRVLDERKVALGGSSGEEDEDDNASDWSD
ncbi:actin nucleation-promoting factor WASL-like isoform X3 [Zophobas morio]|uniref:actin nucleation-promoting factor WASL-like isoform X3 n=1 Tax=Zophobas morio TaxID=2755281 RepID=UPI0030834379